MELILSFDYYIFISGMGRAFIMMEQFIGIKQRGCLKWKSVIIVIG